MALSFAIHSPQRIVRAGCEDDRPRPVSTAAAGLKNRIVSRPLLGTTVRRTTIRRFAEQSVVIPHFLIAAEGRSG
jgi:hypothetical protein